MSYAICMRVIIELFLKIVYNGSWYTLKREIDEILNLSQAKHGRLVWQLLN